MHELAGNSLALGIFDFRSFGFGVIKLLCVCALDAVSTSVLLSLTMFSPPSRTLFKPSRSVSDLVKICLESSVSSFPKEATSLAVAAPFGIE